MDAIITYNLATNSYTFEESKGSIEDYIKYELGGNLSKILDGIHIINGKPDEEFFVKRVEKYIKICFENNFDLLDIFTQSELDEYAAIMNRKMDESPNKETK